MRQEEKERESRGEKQRKEERVENENWRKEETSACKEEKNKFKGKEEEEVRKTGPKTRGG